MASLVTSEKFVMASPLYRQEEQFKRQGIMVSRQTMANWMIKTADWFKTIYDAMHADLVTRNILHADETEVQVLREDGRAAQTTSYMWLYRSGFDGPPIVLFDYQQTRAGIHPKAYLKGFAGYLHVDGWDAYDILRAYVILVLCWAHARRKFDEAVKVLPEEGRQDPAAPAD